MPFTIAGNSGTNWEVGATNRSGRVTQYPYEYGSFGQYALSGLSGTMAAALASNSTIFSFRWADATRLALITAVVIDGVTVIAAATGISTVSLQIFAARSFTVSDSGGTSLLPTGNAAKLRTSMGTTLLTDVRISSTAALTTGTRTLDANPISQILLTNTATQAAGTQLLFDTQLFESNRGNRHPLVLAQNEGFVVRNNGAFGASMTWSFGVTVHWVELAAF